MDVSLGRMPSWKRCTPRELRCSSPPAHVRALSFAECKPTQLQGMRSLEKRLDSMKNENEVLPGFQAYPRCMNEEHLGRRLMFLCLLHLDSP